MKVVFVSNYINHHQIPFCNALYEAFDKSFAFIQTEEMEEDRVKLGWNEGLELAYVHKYYEEADFCQTLIDESDLVVFGGCEDESYLEKRLEENLINKNKPVIRISERLYRWGQWKAISPRGLRKKYHDHTRHKKAPVYLLCAGGYVASDFNIVKAYPGKRYKWGYFPPTKKFESIDELIDKKGYVNDAGERKVSILWVARFIPLKHPEYVIETAKYLVAKGLDFHIDMVGVGPMEEEIKALANGLEDKITFIGQLAPMAVREAMDKADIFMFTSNREEGWGAVINEAMNSGCAVVADHLVGAVPFLIEEGKTGFVYEDGNRQSMFELVEKLVKNADLRREVGAKAYKKIVELWNAEKAAERFVSFANAVIENKELPIYEEGPLSEAKVISEKFLR